MSSSETPAEPAREACDRCGKEAAGTIRDETLCEDCYHGDSSCCGRFCAEEG